MDAGFCLFIFAGVFIGVVTTRPFFSLKSIRQHAADERVTDEKAQVEPA